MAQGFFACWLVDVSPHRLYKILPIKSVRLSQSLSISLSTSLILSVHGNLQRLRGVAIGSFRRLNTGTTNPAKFLGDYASKSGKFVNWFVCVNESNWVVVGEVDITYVLVMKGMVGNGSILEVLILVLVRQGLFMEQVSLGSFLDSDNC